MKEMAKESSIKRLLSFVKEGVWSIDTDALGFAARFGVQLVRLLSSVVRVFLSHRCGLHAAGLTYFSILSVVPILLLMLLLMKPCGMYGWARERLRAETNEMIDTFFNAKNNKAVSNPSSAPAVEKETKSSQATSQTAAEFGVQARQLRDQMLNQVDEKVNSFNFGLMAIVGFCLLAWTVISTFGQIEASLNEIWHAKNRPIWRRAYLYISTTMVVPLLMAFAFSMPLLRYVKKFVDATLGASSYTRFLGTHLVTALNSSLLANLLSLVFVMLAITFLFKAMPNRHVSTRAAVEGGCVTALLLLLWIRICALLQFGIANSSAAYGSFALIPILIVWINVSWTLVILGNIITYALQCLHSRVRDLPELA